MRRREDRRFLPALPIFGALLLFACGCAATSPQPPAQAAPPSIPNLFDVQRQIDQYISSGQYDADVARVAGGYAERTFKLPNPVYFVP